MSDLKNSMTNEVQLKPVLTIGVSSRSLFDINDGHKIFMEKGAVAFDDYMQANEHKPLRPGVAFNVVKKLLALNASGSPKKVRIVLLSSNTLMAGVRIMNTIRHYGLEIETAIFTSGGPRDKLAAAAGVQMFLSTNPQEVGRVFSQGVPSATVMPHSVVNTAEEGQICFAFDGDAVIFDGSSEAVNQSEGLDAFYAHERKFADQPMPQGPFYEVFRALAELQKDFLHLPQESRPLRVALVTARSLSVHPRVTLALRKWNLTVDEALFCGGMAKGPFLAALGADLFFDDAEHNVASALEYVGSCQVPTGGFPRQPVQG